MLIIPTYLAPSPLHGLGVYTQNPLKAGQIVSRFIPPFDVQFPAVLMAVVTPAEQEFLRHYTYRSVFTNVYVLPGDHDRFMNHSDPPNVVMNPDGSTSSIAVRDIVAGEELTCDYRTFDAEWKLKLPHLA